MHIDMFAAVLWGADFLGTSCVLYFLFKKHLVSQWPSLAVLFSTNLLIWVVLASIHQHYRWYFYTYWTWAAVNSGLRIWVLADCLRSIPGTGFISTNARLLLLTAAAGIAVAAGIWALHADGGLTWALSLSKHTTCAKVILDTVLLYNRAANFAVLTFGAASFAIVMLLGLGWEKRGAQIACGLGLELICLTFRASAFTDSQRWIRLFADYCTNYSHIAVLSVWCVAILGSRVILTPRGPSFPFTPPQV